MPDPAPATLRPAPVEPGDVVSYHGTQESLYGRYVVEHVYGDGRMDLADLDDPRLSLCGARPTSITATGETLTRPCQCGHDEALHVHLDTHACLRPGCHCLRVTFAATNPAHP